MAECVVCGLNDFVEQDGMFYCSECNTRREDVRVELFEEKFQGDQPAQPSQWFVCSQVKVEPENDIGNIKVATSWETFNICLRGLVNQLIALGATPVLEAIVFKFWTDYLHKTEAGFFSSKSKPPKLPKRGWTSDAYLTWNIHKKGMSVEDVVGKKQKGKKRKIVEVELSDDCEEPAEKTTKPLHLAKRNFFKKSYDLNKSSNTSAMNDTVAVSALIYKPEEEKEEVIEHPKEIHAKDNHPDLVPLRPKHLLAFLYLGMLVTQQEIHLSDLLRWIEEGHVQYYQLNKFFMPGVCVLSDLKEYFLDKKTTPVYSDISRLTRTLARFLRIRNIPPPDVNGLVHKFCNEFNLPNQVALVSRRLLQLLPIRGQDPEVYSTITSWESRAMAQVIVTLKIIMGLDDASEHRNSIIATQIKTLLENEGNTIDPFIWDDWIQWSALRSIVLLLHGKKAGIHTINTGLYQNIDALASMWVNYVSASMKAKSAKRRKTETELMSEIVRSLNCNDDSSENHSTCYPATTTPYQQYTEAVLSELESGLLPCSDKSWNSLIKNIDLKVLRSDFRSKSIEYLLHPERYIKYAQQKGLAIGLRNGGAFRKTYKSAKVAVPRDDNFRSNVKWLVTLTKKNNKKKEKEIEPSGARSVILRAATEPDRTGGRTLEPLEDLTDGVPSVSTRVEPLPAFPPQAMPLPEEEDQYLHVPCTEYYTHSRKAKDAPISFRHLIEIASRYLYTSKTDLLEEVKVVEGIHKNFLDFCSGKITIDSPEISALKK